jgi:hypothetical protein
MIFSPGYYGRLIELQDGRLMAVAQINGGVGISISYDKGASWNTPELVLPSTTGYKNDAPDLIQLADGTILIGYNPRPTEPYSAERKFGIRVARSTDNGTSWDKNIFVYDASYIFGDGCWEPSFLELPSGELQCYFSNEGVFLNSNEQNISLSRSFDKGLTWTEPVAVSFRSGYRDGMASPILLKNKNEIVFSIEDNGICNDYFRPVTIRTTLEDNWTSGYVDGTSERRDIVFEKTLSCGYAAAAPYLRQLPSGETILSYHGTYGRTTDRQKQDMFVAVGDDNARNFKAISNPFNVGLEKNAMWNSVSVIDTGIVIAVTSTNKVTNTRSVTIIKGVPLKKVFAKYGTATIDGSTSGETWSTAKKEQLVFGVKTKSRWVADFLYDNNYFYITARIIDTETINTETVNDGLRLLLDVDNVSSSSPQKGTYSIFFDLNGNVNSQSGDNGSWVTDSNTEGIRYSVNLNPNRYYIMEAAIPWSLLGKTGPVFNRMAIGLERLDRSASSYIIEGITDVDKNAPYTWLELNLVPDDASSVDEIQDTGTTVTTSIRNNILSVSGNIKILGADIFSIDGKRIYRKKNINSYTFDVPFAQKTGIIRIQSEKHEIITKKIIQ